MTVIRTSRLLTLLAVAILSSALAAAGGPRIRTSDSRIMTAITEGKERSETFREVFRSVERHDVIVYLEMQPQLRGRLSGALTWVVATNEFRYVRVGLNPELSAGQLVAAIAHELQHVSEVGQAPSIVDTASLSAFYRGAGVEARSTTNEWETEAARRTGEIVRREMAAAPAHPAGPAGPERADASRRARVAESIHIAAPDRPGIAQRR